MTIVSTCCQFALAVAFMGGGSTAGVQAVFPSPEKAADALLTALESDNYPIFLSVAGIQMAAFWSTGDPVRDLIERHRFVDAARRSGISMDSGTPGKVILNLGQHTFPAPLLRTESGWRFDDKAGSLELIARRIHRDETAAVELCRRFREAEYQFLALQHDGQPVFAQKIGSSPGNRDGLVWFDNADGHESLLGPSFAAAAFAEPQTPGGPEPLFGYFFKILTAQGPSALGGAFDYHQDGQLRIGFALIAWPAVYRVDGMRTFLIDHLGHVFQRDLGSDTSRIAENVTVLDPDPAWQEVALTE